MTRKYAAIILLFSFILIFSGCVNPGYGVRARVPVTPPEEATVQSPPVNEKHGPPSWAPAHGHRAKYSYRYYPSNEIYFDTGRGIYFYYRNGSWSVSASLPGGISLNVNDYVTLELESDRPYIRHHEIRKKYPPGQVKKMRSGKNKNKFNNRYENRYQYRYYPSDEIYFDTGRGIYFYYRNGSWSASVSLPGGIKLSVDDYVTLELDSDKPYTRHSEIKKKYPPGQVKKKNKDKDRGKNKNNYNRDFNIR